MRSLTAFLRRYSYTVLLHLWFPTVYVCASVVLVVGYASEFLFLRLGKLSMTMSDQPAWSLRWQVRLNLQRHAVKLDGQAKRTSER